MSSVSGTNTNGYKNIGKSDIEMTDMVQKTMREIAQQRKYLFFGGKGGVGKTTMAAATSLWLADHGYNTLVIATDPTVSLPEIFGQRIDGTEPTKIDGVERLHGLNINPKEAPGVFQRRLEGMTSGFGNPLDKEMMSTPCAEEMAAFDQFVGYLQDESYERIVFDTAPTGHTLRELSMPFDWSTFMADQIRDRKVLASSLGWNDPEETLGMLRKEKERYDNAIATLTDSSTTAFNLVLLAEKLPLEETARAVKDLKGFGIQVPSLIINLVIPPESLQGNQLLTRRSENQARYLGEIAKRFDQKAIMTVPLLDRDVQGLESLRSIGHVLFGG
ncbi:MAG: putative arsenical pump-driving ATPase [Methanomassiliicoccales archaeon PtaU1.Bin124]|nr:MAG: putative arsenical pump-driving ATPase [Methanomassiliicoccales archaeon PtaU1.Bin124]